MVNKILFKIDDFDYLIELSRQSKNSFQVIYGKQTKTGLTREQAAAEFGYCLMHALECEGKLD